LTQYGAPTQIDFMSLDLEGYEINALRGLDLNRYRPKYMLIESRDSDEIKDYLKEFSYKFVCKLTVHDFLFVDNRPETLG